ncbi:MAG: dihydroorotate dehydrogenase, partial [Bacteroidota bacterium]|nr:dihydroorotate dehydrogenase [Bacteroidota bacterium]
MVNLGIKIHELDFKNPIMLASGTCGFGEEIADFLDLSRLGGMVVKGTTLKHREGNAYP